MNRKLYLFDFDGTISSKDSFSHFFVKTFGKKKIALKLIANFHKIFFTVVTNKEKSKVKELIISLFLKGKTKQEIESLGKEYSNSFINQIIRTKALDYISNLNEKNNIYIVSASLSFWLSNFAKNIGVNLISTELAYENNIFTGKFKGENCKGKEKVNRIKKEISLNEYTKIISFGDSKGDREMFAISTEVNYKPFRTF